MQYWTTVRVQCDAEEVLNKECHERHRLEMLTRTHRGPDSFIRRAGDHPIGLDIDSARWLTIGPVDRVDWQIVKTSTDRTYYFCPEHAVEGKAELEG